MKCRPRPRSCKPKPRHKKRCPKKNCARQGRLTSNPFLNFLREYRKKHCGMTMTQIAIKGAQMWCGMSRAQKCPYVLAARKVQQRSKPKRRKRGC